MEVKKRARANFNLAECNREFAVPATRCFRASEFAFRTSDVSGVSRGPQVGLSGITAALVGRGCTRGVGAGAKKGCEARGQTGEFIRHAGSEQDSTSAEDVGVPTRSGPHSAMLSGKGEKQRQQAATAASLQDHSWSNVVAFRGEA